MPDDFNPYEVPQGQLTPIGGVAVAPCHKCGSGQADRIKFTWWGGVVGPKLFHHVKCRGCGEGIDARTGQSNAKKIRIYIAVSWGIVALVFVAAFLLKIW